MITRVTKTEFETDDGVIHDIPFELDEVPTIEEFQKIYDGWFRLFQQKGLIDKMDKKILSISDAASILGVSDETLRNWERAGKLTPFHTEGRHRRYYRSDIEKLAGIYVEPIKESSGKRAAIYCRVSPHEQKTKGDLGRQVGRMTTEALKRGYSIIAVII